MQTAALLFFALPFVGGIAVATAMFLKTPAEYRFKFSSHEYKAKQREEELLSGATVIIEAQPIKALIRALPWTTVVLPLMAFGLYIKSAHNLACDSLCGISSVYLAVICMSYVIPITSTLWAITCVPRGLKVLKEGYFPPLDTASFIRMVARRGVMSTARGYVIVALPLFFAATLYHGHGTYEGFMKGRSYAEFQNMISNKCTTTR